MANEAKTSEQVIRDALREGRFEVKNSTRGTCPCGEEFRVGEVDGVPVVLHASPICKDFIDRDPLDFMHWVNVQQGRYN